MKLLSVSSRLTTRHSSLCLMKIWRRWVSPPLEPDARCYWQSQVRVWRPGADSDLLLHLLTGEGGACLLSWKWWSYLSSHIDLNKSKRRLSDTPAVKPGYLEGGASGRLPRIMDLELAAQSNRWWDEMPACSTWSYSASKLVYSHAVASADV